ncbi:MAG: hypothetical protein DRP74_03340 [Candidatus Omnitrophota bacterium]|nr:MAG: hypothetical protein DRP74_03340 [Candidatus Omnitrophota bacterium]
MKIKILRNISRAFRLAFLAASVLPFIFGSLIDKSDFNFVGFILGLIAVSATHLSANLINDYADSRSGADWQDKRFYKFFGGSKLIQEGVVAGNFYFKTALFFALFAFFSVLGLSYIQGSFKVIGFYLLIIFLGWAYSCKPLQLSYRHFGEIIIFLLFGPAVVMGGYFIQTGIFPDAKSFILSLPFGIFTCAILFVNEIPDFPEDKRAQKLTWVDFLGAARSYLLYAVLMFLAFSAIGVSIGLGYLGKIALFSFILVLPALKAIDILRLKFSDKIELTQSSRLTIVIQGLAGVILILDKLL